MLPGLLQAPLPPMNIDNKIARIKGHLTPWERERTTGEREAVIASKCKG